ncbi:MAG: hypothetical protein JO257_28170 [Deltaproteobacteria bacterium]|nr:hypothetical protein [Deltaproteobacteria bacterium]
MRLAYLLPLLAACPPKHTQPPGPAAATGAGCPSADGVFVASYVTDAPGRGAGWVMPLHSMKVEPGAQVPEYQQLDEASATASGVPAPPQQPLWLVTESAPPCKATLRGYYAAKIAGPPASISYGAELEGCPAPADPQEGGGIVLASAESPGACRFETPKPAGARLGEMDQQQQWHAPTKQTPIPPPLAALVPAHDCVAPGCEQLWAFGEVEAAGQPAAWGGAVNWLTIGKPDDACHWKAEQWSGLFVPGPGGTAQKLEFPGDHALALAAVLVDAGGAKVLFAEGPGEYATYDLQPSAKLARHITWMLAPDEEWAMVDHLGPLCPKEQAKPAPLPKDAKPQSPYGP